MYVSKTIPEYCYGYTSQVLMNIVFLIVQFKIFPFFFLNFSPWVIDKYNLIIFKYGNFNYLFVADSAQTHCSQRTCFKIYWDILWPSTGVGKLVCGLKLAHSLFLYQQAKNGTYILKGLWKVGKERKGGRKEGRKEDVTDNMWPTQLKYLLSGL